MRIHAKHRPRRPFLQNIAVCEHGENCKACCWPWERTIDSKGYGRTRYSYYGVVETYSHRIAWTLHYKRLVPRGYSVMHSCCNPSCCNHYHLTIAKPEEIVRWRIEDIDKRRAEGKKIGNEKLTVDQVIQVRAMAKEGISQIAIASEMGVSQPAISYIVTGRTWGHLNAG